MVNNLNDGLAWGLFPILFATSGLGLTRIGVLAAIYPAVWGLGQTVTGALSDRWGRKWLIAAGMLVQAAGIALVAIADSFSAWAVAAVLMGAGTAMVYPTLLAVIGDVAHPTWRARAVGVYRLWRDAGYAIGALIAGITADLLGIRAADLAYRRHHRRLRHRRRRANVRDTPSPRGAQLLTLRPSGTSQALRPTTGRVPRPAGQ